MNNVALWMDGPWPSLDRAAAWAAEPASWGVNVAYWPLNQGIRPYYRTTRRRAVLAKVLSTSLEVYDRTEIMGFPSYRNVDAYLDDLEQVLHLVPKWTRIVVQHNLEPWSGWPGRAGRSAAALVRGIAQRTRLSQVEHTVNSVPVMNGPASQDKALTGLGRFSQIITQAYSGRGRKWDTPTLYRPGVFQRHAMAQLRQALADGTVQEGVVGLHLAYQDKHPDPWPKGLAANDMAVATCVVGGFRSFAFWSRKHVKEEHKAWFWRVRQADGTGAYEPPRAAPQSQVKDLQRLLKARGFNPGSVDGVYGPRTKAALAGYRAALARLDHPLLREWPL